LKPSGKFLILTGIAMQMGITIFAGAYFGKYLDEQYPSSKKWFTMLFTILSMGVSIYLVLKQLKKLNDQN